MCSNPAIDCQKQFRAQIPIFCSESCPNIETQVECLNVSLNLTSEKDAFQKCILNANARRHNSAHCSLHSSIPRCSIIASSLRSTHVSACKIGPRSLGFKESLKVFVWHTSFIFSSQSKKNRYMCPLAFGMHWNVSNGRMVWKR